MYRETYSLFACSGILFNHESPRRGFEFVTRKITSTAVKIKLGLEKELRLGNIETKKDWGFAGDYVEAMWLMLQQDKPDDYVIGTGENHTVKEFIELVFGYLDLDWRKYVIIDEKLYRPAEVYELKADYSKAKKILGWEPKVKFRELVKMMVEEDLKLFSDKK
jgi:GDPmannose 4,6-dehydratase